MKEGIRKKSTKVVIYAGGNYILSNTGLKLNGTIVPGITAVEYELFHFDSMPSDFCGNHYTCYNGVWERTQEGEAAIQERIIILKAQKQDIINDGFEKRIATLRSNATPSEVDTFTKQEEQALAYRADPVNAEVDFIQTLAEKRGLTLAELVTRILSKSTYYSTHSSNLLGLKHAYGDQLCSATTIEEIEAIEVTYEY